MIQGLDYHYFRHYSPCSAELLHLTALKLDVFKNVALFSKISQEHKVLQSFHKCLSTSSKLERRTEMFLRYICTYTDSQESTLCRALKGGHQKKEATKARSSCRTCSNIYCVNSQNTTGREVSGITRVSSKCWSSSLSDTWLFTSLQIPFAFP